MSNFDLKKYLANNPLLNEGLSNQEQMVVDDILSVTEGAKDVYNKLVSYGKKGMITLAVLASVLTGCAQQGDMDSAQATIEYAIENEWKGSEEDKLYMAMSEYIINTSEPSSFADLDSKETIASDYAMSKLGANIPGRISNNFNSPEVQEYIKNLEDMLGSDEQLKDKYFKIAFSKLTNPNSNISQDFLHLFSKTITQK